MSRLEAPDGSRPMKRSRSDQGPEHPSLPLRVVDEIVDTEAAGPDLALPGDGSDDSEFGIEVDDGENDEGGVGDDMDSVTTSTFEDAMDEAEDRPYYPTEDGEVGFTVVESKAMLARLRKVGAERFLSEMIVNGTYSVRHLLTAFGVRPDLPYSEAWYTKFLGLCIQRELRRRQKLHQYNTIDDAVSLLQTSNNIVVITGAGISTSLGIPDFRSKNTGFYAQLPDFGLNEPEEVFDLRLFDDDPSIFYKLANGILPVTDRCSTTHAFLKLLQDKDKLLTNYSQNIDNIEQIAGIKKDKLIQCHGSWATAKCRKCGHEVDGKEIFQDVKAQRIARCKACVSRLQVERPKKRKRGSAHSSRSRKSGFSDDDDDEGDYDIPEPGVMKPGITFFHEQLPNTFFDRLTDHDRDLVDLVVVIGTSMKVSPVNEIPNFIPASVPQIYISREPVKHINFDIQLLGYCDDVVSELSRRAGWTIDHQGHASNIKADVRGYEEDVSGSHWCVSIPGKEHTAEEKNDPGR